MSPAAFIDANVPIYAAGRDHPYKAPCGRLLIMAAEKPEAFVTNAEVFQELLHRYVAIGRWPQGRNVVTRFADLMAGRIEPLYSQDVLLAADMANEHQRVSPRDLVHAAVMFRIQVHHIISADRDFDRVPGIARLDPLQLEEWQNSVMGS
ncbi:MAG: type II toxin-antitoxin system VapC family toxin [Chloroflexi bacterium]|nr:type II toxin-antitoxin system VapC family toxin [Chloroflexota bacterium]